MPPKIYIDGQAGTTALRIREWLVGRNDLEVIALPEELRKDAKARKQALRDAAVVLLCLPDDAAREAATWLADSPVRILDASTAHRISQSWVYGLPELVPVSANASPRRRGWPIRMLFVRCDFAHSPPGRRRIDRSRLRSIDSRAFRLFGRRPFAD